jgi:hypothetical protein
MSVEGGIYHVYNRLARGAELFSNRKRRSSSWRSCAWQRCCAALGLTLDQMAGRGKGREISRTRYPIATFGIERWETKAKPLSELVGRWPEAISRRAGRGAEMRMASEDFSAELERLDQTRRQAESRRQEYANR